MSVKYGISSRQERGDGNVTWRLLPFGDTKVVTVSHTRWRPAMDNGVKGRNALATWNGAAEVMSSRKFNWLMQCFKHHDEQHRDTVSAQNAHQCSYPVQLQSPFPGDTVCTRTIYGWNQYKIKYINIMFYCG